MALRSQDAGSCPGLPKPEPHTRSALSPQMHIRRGTGSVLSLRFASLQAGASFVGRHADRFCKTFQALILMSSPRPRNEGLFQLRAFPRRGRSRRPLLPRLRWWHLNLKQIRGVAQKPCVCEQERPHVAPRIRDCHFFTSFHSGKEGTDGELASHSARISLWAELRILPSVVLVCIGGHASHPIGRVPFSSSSLQPIPFVLKTADG